MAEPIGKSYQPWLVASLVVLVLSLLLLAVAGTVLFVSYAGVDAPLWAELLLAVAVLGVAAGFAGFFGLMMIAGWTSFRERRRVQVISPAHERSKG